MTLLCRSSFVYFAIFIFTYCIAYSKLTRIANQDCIRYRNLRVSYFSRGEAKRNYWRGGQPNLPAKKTSLTFISGKTSISSIYLLQNCRQAKRWGADLPHLLWPRPFIFLCYTPQSMLAYGNGYFRPFLEIQYKSNMHHIVL